MTKFEKELKQSSQRKDLNIGSKIKDLQQKRSNKNKETIQTLWKQQKEEESIKRLENAIAQLKKTLAGHVKLNKKITQHEKKIARHSQENTRITKLFQLEQKLKQLQKEKKQKDQRFNKLERLETVMKEIKTLVSKFKKDKQLIPQDKQRLAQLRNHIENQQDILVSLNDQEEQKFPLLRKNNTRHFRTQVFHIKFSSDYYHFLKKKMMDPKFKTALKIIDFYPTASQKGLAFEALWTILISLGFCKKFPRQHYNFYDAELKEPTSTTRHYFIEEIVSRAQYLQFLKQTAIKGTNGKSDITLRNKNDGTWIFISCKLYKNEHGDYDISPIYKAITETNTKYPNRIGTNYKIYIFVKDKADAYDRIINSTTIKNLHIQDKITTGIDYNILGIDDLEECFKEFRKMSWPLSWDAFENEYIKHYDKIPSLKLRLDQVPIVNETISIISRTMEQQICNNLRIYWKMFPQFGKTYCVGKLFADYFGEILKKSQYFNVVVIVDRPETAWKYANEILGGHEQFIDDFNVTVVNNRKPDTQSIANYLRKSPTQKTIATLQKNKHKNNIIIVLKNDLELVKDITNLSFIIFDQYDDKSETEFKSFSQSPNKIGLFLTSTHPKKIKTDRRCSFLLEWNWDDTKALRQIYEQLKTSQSKNILGYQSTKSLIQKHKQTLGGPLRNVLQTATQEHFESCLKNSMDLYIVSDFLLQPNQSIAIPTYSRSQSKQQGGASYIKTQQQKEAYKVLLGKIKKTLDIIDNKKTDKTSFTTQLWFTNGFQMNQHLKEHIVENEHFKNFDIVIYNIETQKQHPTPIKADLRRLTSHYQNIAKTHTNPKKKGLIILLNAVKSWYRKIIPDVERDLSFPNVDVVFALNNEDPKSDAELLSYIMMSKCMTPKQGKESMFFVDFDGERVQNLLYAYFGDAIANITRLVKLVDINNPTLTSTQVILRPLILRKQAKKAYSRVLQQFRKKYKPIAPDQKTKSKPTQRTTTSSSRAEPQSPQQWLEKWQNDRKYFTSYDKYQGVAKAVGIDIRYPEGMTKKVQKRNHIKSVLLQKQKQLGSFRTTS